LTILDARSILIDRSYAVGSSNRAFHLVNGRIACGSMVHFDLFSQKICTVCKFFVKKIGSSALPEPALSVVEWGDIRHQPGSPDAGQHWTFRGVRSCRGVRGPNAHRGTPVNDMRYAVTDPEEHFASGRVEDTSSFARNLGSLSPNFVQTKQKYHAAAGESGRSSKTNAWFDHPLRNSCE
jgi:hypothetical protein